LGDVAETSRCRAGCVLRAQAFFAQGRRAAFQVVGHFVVEFSIQTLGTKGVP
jgi:hypothetical protein